MAKYATACLAALLLAALSGQAAAHAHLVSAAPAANTIVTTAPAALQLLFSEALELKFSGVTLASSNKVAVQTGSAILSPGNARSLEVPVTGPMSPGRYTVEWHVLSKDGHKTHGAYAFTLKPQ